MTRLFFFGKTFTDLEGNRQRLKPIDFQVLSLLQEQGNEGMTGYKIIETLKERFKGLWTPSAGTIFPVLKRLNDDALITNEGTAVGDRSAVAHKISEQGQAALKSQISEDTEQELKFIGDYLRQIFGRGPYSHRFMRVANFMDRLLEQAGTQERDSPPEEKIPPEVAEKYTEIFNRIMVKIQQFDPSVICHCETTHPSPGQPPFKLPPIKPPLIPRERPPKEVKGRPIPVEGDDDTDGQ